MSSWKEHSHPAPPGVIEEGFEVLTLLSCLWGKVRQGSFHRLG